jgi:hypothetical protein
MNPVKLIRQAACSNAPIAELKHLVRELSDKGHAKGSIYQFFQDALLEVRAAHHGEESAEETAILEVMDLLSGFCDQDLVLLPE